MDNECDSFQSIIFILINSSQAKEVYMKFILTEIRNLAKFFIFAIPFKVVYLAFGGIVKCPIL